MTRFSFFSYIENLKTGSLVLDDPFAVDPADGMLCRYELQGQSAELLHPDEIYNGFLRWHRFLPFHGEMAVTDAPLLVVEKLNHPRAHEVDGLFEARPHALLVDAIVNTMAASQKSANVKTEPWSNPFRIEAWRAVGLELAHHGRNAEVPPAIIVQDDEGERLLGLIEAFNMVKELSGRVPYRLILLQEEGRHDLCLAFEGHRGAALDHLPEGAVIRILQGVTDAMGTAMRLEQASDDAALELLLRTHFVDDEDQVYLLR